MKTEVFRGRATPEEKRAWEIAAGHEPFSSWARRHLNAAAANEDVFSAPVGAIPETPGLPSANPNVLPAAQCARWMHHRPGTFCSTCNKIPATP